MDREKPFGELWGWPAPAGGYGALHADRDDTQPEAACPSPSWPGFTAGPPIGLLAAAGSAFGFPFRPLPGFYLGVSVQPYRPSGDERAEEEQEPADGEGGAPWVVAAEAPLEHGG